MLRTFCLASGEHGVGMRTVAGSTAPISTTPSEKSASGLSLPRPLLIAASLTSHFCLGSSLRVYALFLSFYQFSII